MLNEAYPIEPESGLPEGSGVHEMSMHAANARTTASLIAFLNIAFSFLSAKRDKIYFLLNFLIVIDMAIDGA